MSSRHATVPWTSEGRPTRGSRSGSRRCSAACSTSWLRPSSWRPRCSATSESRYPERGSSVRSKSMSSLDPGAREVRDAFLRVFRADLAIDRVRSEADYRALYPGHEQEISDELALLQDGPLAVAKLQTDQSRGGEQIGPYRI